MKIDGSYVTALKAFLWYPDFPKLMAMVILQKELGWKFNKISYQSMFRYHNGETCDLHADSQVTQGSQHQSTLDIIEEEEGPRSVADLGEEAFSDLPDGCPDYVWNTNCDLAAEPALAQYKKRVCHSNRCKVHWRQNSIHAHQR
jgi:hypothetical protein